MTYNASTAEEKLDNH
ncbi:Protein of unknown function [Weissella confusa LBAE C39-2]|nr:Protein of unknown function [Weissella confusa LBAE C39-2]